MEHYIVIGGEKGLGQYISHILAGSGDNGVFSKVHTLSRSSEIPLDLSWDADYITEFIQKYVKEYCDGNLSGLVVSSGMGAYYTPMVKGSTVEEMFKVNTLGPMAVFRGAQKGLLRSRGNAVFITSSCSRKPGAAGLSVYAGTKAAIHGWIISEARRQVKKGVGLCAVAPGWFDSPMVADLKPRIRAAATKAIPAGRFGNPGNIAEFVVNLVEFGDSWCIAGSIFELTGGA